MNKLVFLLTGSIDPLKELPFTNLLDPEIRKRQYIEAIFFYLKSFAFPVVFVENTGNDLKSFFSNELHSNRLEILTFKGNNYDPKLGKGVGEFECIKYAIDHSKFISNESFIFKITGRYQLWNLNKFVKQWEKNKNIYILCNTNFSKAYTDTRFIGFNPEFINKYLHGYIKQLNDSEGIYLEHIVFISIKSAIANKEKVDLFKGSPNIVGIAGSMNLPYKSSILRHIFRNIRDILNYYRFHLNK